MKLFIAFVLLFAIVSAEIISLRTYHEKSTQVIPLCDSKLYLVRGRVCNNRTIRGVAKLSNMCTTDMKGNWAVTCDSSVVYLRDNLLQSWSFVIDQTESDKSVWGISTYAYRTSTYVKTSSRCIELYETIPEPPSIEEIRDDEFCVERETQESETLEMSELRIIGMLVFCFITASFVIKYY